MSIENTKEIVTRYINSKHTDTGMMSSEVTFTNMATGEKYIGPENVSNMMNYIYHVAFDADADVKNLFFTDDKAVLEADFIGKHIAEFAGVKATNKNVRIPLCVVYDIEDEKIKRGRIYFELPAFFAQVNNQ